MSLFWNIAALWLLLSCFAGLLLGPIFRRNRRALGRVTPSADTFPVGRSPRPSVIECVPSLNSARPVGCFVSIDCAGSFESGKSEHPRHTSFRP
jgi:hypothetical protein